MRSWWRTVIFVAVTLIAAGLGLRWHQSAEGLKTPELIQKPVPLQIAIYGSDPSIPVSATVFVAEEVPGTWWAQLAIDTDKPEVLMVAANQPGRAIDQALAPDTGADANMVLDQGVYEALFATRTHANVQFDLPRGQVDETPDEIQARLPLFTKEIPVIGPTNVGYVGFPHTPRVIMSNFIGTITGPKLCEKPQLHVCGPVETTYEMDGKPITGTLRAPARLSVEHDWDVGQQDRRTYAVVTQIPPLAKVDGTKYVWMDAIETSPTYLAASRARDDRRSGLDFQSGVAFAMAAAGLMAVVQEGKDHLPAMSPASWVLRLRRRYRSERFVGMAADPSDSYDI